MKTFKEQNPLLVKLLTVILLGSLCCNLPSLLYSSPFWTLCREQDRNIPPNTEVLISACNKRLIVTVTPDGKALFVREVSASNALRKVSGSSSAYRLDDVYLLDLHTGEKRDVPEDPLLMETVGELLSSELYWLWGDPDYILDLTNGQRYELINLNQKPFIDNKFDLKYYKYFQSAEQVFILQKHNRVIALSPNFRQNPEGNVIYFEFPPNGDFKDGAMVEKLMNDLGVKYKIVDFPYSYSHDTDLLSPTGRYVVHDNGIYLSETNTVVLNRDMSDFQGWYYDESGVVIQESGYHLIDLGSAFGNVYEYYYIPSPVLKLRLPAP